MTSRLARVLTTTIVLAAAVICRAFAETVGRDVLAPSKDRIDVVVLADPADPYRTLGAEIAAVTTHAVAPDLASALKDDPAFLLWVASPPFLSEAALADLGRALAQHKKLISVGIITGSTLVRARELWRRRDQAKTGVTIHIIGAQTIVDYSSRPPALVAFTPETLRSALRRADCLLFSGHGTPHSWQGLRSSDVPALPPLVAAAASCRTFQPWHSDGIALAFVDQGASAYAGFVSSPSGDYMIGEHGETPLAHTWPGFPIGHVVQVQSRGAMQAFARWHQYFLLGDPRLSVRDRPPYRIVQDTVAEGTRTIVLDELPAGTVPIAIPGAAGYRWLEIPGVGVWSADAWFFNARIQTTDQAGTKFALVNQPGGGLTLRLRERPPLFAATARNLTDFADIGLIASNGSAAMTGLGALVGAAVAGWMIRRRRLSGRGALAATCLGLALTGVAALFAGWRHGHISVTAVPHARTAVEYALEAALLVVAGAIFLGSRSKRGRGAAVVLATFPAWIVPIILLPLAVIMQTFIRPPAVLYEHHAMQYALGARVLIQAAFFSVMFGLTRRIAGIP